METRPFPPPDEGTAVIFTAQKPPPDRASQAPAASELPHRLSQN